MARRKCRSPKKREGSATRADSKAWIGNWHFWRASWDGCEGAYLRSNRSRMAALDENASNSV